MKDTETIAWECPCCHHRHLWTWPAGEASEGDVTMVCDMCGSNMATEFVRIARRVWSVLWPGR